MVRLRLTRGGRHKRPFYRIVAADSRMPRDGRYIEVLGTYDPLKTPAAVTIKQDRVMAWLAWAHGLIDPIKRRLKTMFRMWAPKRAARTLRLLARIRRRMQAARAAA